MFGVRAKCNLPTEMHVYRRVPGVVARQLRATGTRFATPNHIHALGVSLRFEPSATRALSTSESPASRPRSTPPVGTPPSTLQNPLSPASLPAMSMLQTLADWKHSGLARAVSSEPSQRGGAEDQRKRPAKTDEKLPSLTVRNRAFRKAIEEGDFVRAQEALEALLAPWNPTQHAHPVDTENYDRLLFQWSQQCGKRATTHSGSVRIDLTPMLSLLENMVAWNRVNARSFNTALVACLRVRSLDSGERVLEMMKQSGRQPKAFAYTNLISCCGRLASKHKGRQAQFVDDAERFFQELVEGGTGVTIEAVNAMVFVYRASRGYSHVAVELVERAIQEWDLQPDSSTIAPLVISLLKDKNPLEASRWIEYALKHRVSVDDTIVRSAIDELRRDGQWDKIQSLRLLLQERGVGHNDHGMKKVLKQGKIRDANVASPSTIVQGSMRNKVQKSEATTAVNDVIRRVQGGERIRMAKAEWASMFEYGKIDDLDNLMQLISTPSVHQDSLPPLHWLNEMYLRALSSAGQWWGIVRALDAMLEKSPKDVNVNCFNAAMRGCTRAGRLHEAVLVLERMEQIRIPPNRQSYDALLLCCGSIGSVEAAMQFFHEMERSNIKPTTGDLNAVLKALATAVQRLLEASQDETADLDVPASDLSKLAVHSLHFFEDVTAKYEGIEINESTVLHLFRSFLGAAEVFDAVDLDEFEAFAKDNDHPQHPSRAEWTLLSNAVQRICREASIDVVSPRVINVGIDFFQRRGDPNNAFELFNTMMSRDIPPTSDSIRLLFAACCSGDEDTELGLFFLEHLLRDVNDRGESELAATIASEALRWAGRMTNGSDENGSALVDIVFDKLISAGALKKDGSVYSRVMAVFGLDGNLVQAQRVADRMLLETGSLSLSVANRLLQACSVARTPIAALHSLGWMRRHGAQPDRVSYNSVFSAIRRHQERNRRFTRHIVDDEEIYDDTSEDTAEGSEERDIDYDEDDLPNVRLQSGDGDHALNSRQERLSRLETDFNGVLDGLMAAMDDDGVAPDANTFECLITIALQRGEVKRVLALFDDIKAAAKVRQVDVSALLTQKTILQYLDGCSAVASVEVSDITSRVDEVRSLLAAWYRDRGYRVSASVLLRILSVYDALGQWRDAVTLTKNAFDDYAVAPNVEMFRAAMETSNRAGQHKIVEQIFVTMQKPGGPTGRIYPTAACYIEAIYALEQQGNWIQATQMFMEMQKKCATEDLHPTLLNRIALGRYAEGRKRPD